MKILFLDQSGNLGGAELCLSDIANPYKENCLVGLLADGTFRQHLEQQQIPVQVLTSHSICVRKESNLLQSLTGASSLIPLIIKIVDLARNYDLIYTNTPKALVVGSIASLFARLPFVYHLHDILSSQHFSFTNRRIAITLANCASLVIANSEATRTAFIKAGGRSELVKVVYNGFDPKLYQSCKEQRIKLRQQLKLDQHFVVGHFSRLSPWKGQHILLEALADCPNNVRAIFVGDALFGEQDYVQQLYQQVAKLGLEKRVQFLGFRSDIVPLMSACDVIAHTSTAPEPFGRVIIEGMLCGRPVVATDAGGASELVEPGKTGWLFPPKNYKQLAQIITTCYQQPEQIATIAKNGQLQASQRFQLAEINCQISTLLERALIH
jgi:glycosyltransferase involved in cell wall biosynthesis